MLIYDVFAQQHAVTEQVISTVVEDGFFSDTDAVQPVTS
jgi:hypothetical protein